MHHRTLGSLGVVLFLSAGIAGQTPTQLPGSAMPGPASRPPQPANAPPRDSPSSSATGTGSISGRILSAENGTPLRLVQIRLNTSDGRTNATATSDADGKYEFSNLPAGAYRLSASRSGYPIVQYGQPRLSQPGKPIEIANGQRLDKIDFSLPKGGVIAGRITDPWGEPALGMRLHLWRWTYSSRGERQLTGAPTSNFGLPMTDDLGQFRIYGLQAGEYIVSATPAGGMSGRPGPTNNIVGSGTDNDDGFLTSYYPGTSSPNQAQAVTVQFGRESSIFFAMTSGRLSRISGMVRNSLGRPVANAMLSLRVSTENFSMTTGGGTGPDGVFTFVNVQPGEYTLDVRPRPGAAGGPASAPNGGDQEFAAIPISVNGSDLTGLVITTGTGATVSGRVIFEGTPPTNPSATRVNLSYSPPASGPMNGVTSVVVDEAGRFQMRGVGGKALFRAAPPPGWMLKSVMLDGVDITDVPYDVRRDITGVEITVTDRVTNVSGAVRNLSGELIKDFIVMTFPANMGDGTVPSRFTQMVRPNADGRYVFKTLPPGDYLIGAVTAIDEPGQQFSPEFQHTLRTRGHRFSLAEGETASFDLQLIQ